MILSCFPVTIYCKRISNKIKPTILGFEEAESATITAAVHFPLNQYWFAMKNAGSSEHDRIIVYDFVNNAYSVHTGIEASFMNTLSKSGIQKVYTGDYSGYTLEQDSGNSDVLDGSTGQTIDSTFKTAWFPLSNPAVTKNVQHTMVYHGLTGDYNVGFGYSYDFEDSDRYSGNFSVSAGGDTWDSFSWDDGTLWASSGGGSITRIDNNGAGAFYRIRFHHNADNAAWEIYGISPIFRVLGIHRPSSFT